ncbi:MAG: nucleoside deaminase [Treponema sp.]|nr:nucleoside deaminase [Candidatus Treponema merdequi]
MQIALDEAYNGIGNGDGGPFGSVITKENHIIGRGHNRVLKNGDPTCHGEMEAIRDACRNSKTITAATASNFSKNTNKEKGCINYLYN